MSRGDGGSRDGQTDHSAVPADGGAQGAVVAPDPNRAEWLDLAHSDQAFEEWPAVVEDSSLGLTLTEAEPLAPRAARRRRQNL